MSHACKWENHMTNPTTSVKQVKKKGNWSFSTHAARASPVGTHSS